MSESMMKILLVDDDECLLRMVCFRLKRHYEVITASCGEDALKMIDDGLTPDIVLLDIDMPGMDGFEAFSFMRERQAMEYVPIVFFTALTSEENKVKGLKMGAADYLTKPFEGEVMTRRIPMYVEAARTRRKLREMEKNGAFLIDEDKFAYFTSRLSTREKEVARLLLLGESNSMIVEKLSYPISTVKKLVSLVYDKLGFNCRRELKDFFRA